jgi:ribosome-associated toxin RatA of RatAB toxin-antitoxin module
MNRSRLLALTALTMLAVPATSQAQTKDARRLAKGEIIVKAYKVKGSDVPKAVVRAVVNSPPEKVWEVVSNCNKFNKRFDRVAKSKLLKRSGEDYTCTVTIDMPFPIGDLTGVTRAKHTIKNGKRLRKWSLIKGDYRINNGSWLVEDYGNGKSMVTYSIHAEPNVPIPGWIRDEAQKSNLPNVIKRLRKEARKI